MKPPWWSILLVGGTLAVGGYVTGNKWVWIGAGVLPTIMLGANLVCGNDQSQISQRQNDDLAIRYEGNVRKLIGVHPRAAAAIRGHLENRT